MTATARNRLRILLVDDDERTVTHLHAGLSARFVCEVASSNEAALTAVTQEAFDVVVARHDPLDTSGFDLLAATREQSPATKVILVGSDASAGNLLEAGRRGAWDYLLWPVDEQLLMACVDRISQRDSGRPPVLADTPFSPGTIVGSSPALLEVLQAVDRVAHSLAPVLLVGETGTGKDLLAARIHARGPRRHRPYVVINAGAIPATLLDSELFGHVAGAFTGAARARRGLILEADGGTLFLDEIADLPIELQGRMLRVLEAQAIRPVGGDHERQVDVRFIAATHRDLSFAVRQGTFREDLYFRLNVLAIPVPALRDRLDDLPALIKYFFDEARVRNPRSPVEEIAPGANVLFLSHPWNGNVRELQACIERLVVLGKTARVEESDVAAIFATRADGSERSASEPGAAPLASDLVSIREMTMRHVTRVLAHTGGDKAGAAAILGVDVSTLYRWQHRRSAPDSRRRKVVP